jgi:hypothetical protein
MRTTGTVRTGADGEYEIRYTRDQLTDSDVTATDLVVRAVDADGNIVATSPVWFNAPDEVTIDLAVSGAVAGSRRSTTGWCSRSPRCWLTWTPRS